MSKIAMSERAYTIEHDPYKFGVIGSNNSATWRKILRSYTKPFSSIAAFLTSITSFFPFLEWLPQYKVSEQLYGDVMAGIMMGIFNITQGMAYAILSGVPAVNGLYATFIGALAFPIFTTWMHGSLGPFAIVGVMCRASQEQFLARFEDANFTTSTVISPELLNPSVVVSALTFLVGIVCLVFAITKLEFFAEYFSEPLVSGFITAAALHVFVSQLDTILGVPKPNAHGFAYLFKNVYIVLMQIPHCNVISLGLFLGSIAYLVITKFIINPALKRIWKGQHFVIPYELFLVVVTTFLSYFFEFSEVYDVKVVGEVPTGLPSPRLPEVALFRPLLFDAVALAIVVLAVHLSLARIFCAKKKYSVDDNQELYAYGFSLSLAGFFPVFPPSTGLGRPFIAAECGATSPVSSVVSATLVLVVLLVLGPLFYWLPLTALSAIVIVALRSLFKGFFELPRLWTLCRWDFSVWLVTFSAAMLTDVIYGLGVGMLFELFAVSARTQWPQWQASFYCEAESSHICIFRLESMLLFTNATMFKKKVQLAFTKWPKPTPGRTKAMIFDCSAMTDADFVGLKALAEMVEHLRGKECDVYFGCVQEHILDGLRKLGEEVDDHHVFPVVDEAIWEVNRLEKVRRRESSTRLSYTELRVNGAEAAYKS